MFKAPLQFKDLFQHHILVFGSIFTNLGAIFGPTPLLISDPCVSCVMAVGGAFFCAEAPSVVRSVSSELVETLQRPLLLT